MTKAGTCNLYSGRRPLGTRCDCVTPASASRASRASRGPRALLVRMLKSVNKTKTAALEESHETARPVAAVVVDPPAYTKKSRGPKKKSAGPTKRPELLQILANVTDRPLREITLEATLEDLGLDSLMATELLNDIRTVLGLTIDLTSFLFFPNIQAVAVYVDEQLGLGGGGDDANDNDDNDDETDDEEAKRPASRADSGIADINISGTTSPARQPPADVPRSTITNALEAFRETRLNYDQLAKVTQAVDFWKDAYPHQKRLVLGYTVEAFAQIGCDMKTLRAGDAVPQVQGTLERHAQLVWQFYRVLEDGALIEADEASSGRSIEPSFIRTSTPLDPVPAETIYQQTVSLHPQHATATHLVRAVGSELAPLRDT
ncbi:hypothetical protein B0I37DRAFT_424351 [Chaetomium sp. MPI-CAGE-AT-0009]|nr:hypothetical protein B0I37DRAFT_424351 [Chaetomium sp. MPI-CAGE-AT-0009]